MISFKCKNCGRKIKAQDSAAGKKGRCPQCKQIVVIPLPKNAALIENNLDIKPESPQKEFPGSQAERPRRTFADEFASGLRIEQVQKNAEAEKNNTRKLPAIIDIFLYPTSVSGIVNLCIFWILPILIGGFAQTLPNFPLPLICSLGNIVIAAYMYYYLIECIRDSALGGLRAPQTIGTMPEMGQAFSKLLEIIASVTVFWGPAFFYSLFARKTDRIFFSLLAYGIFFFPMGLLALAMFDSVYAFNPFLWIVSILKTFFQYCFLVLLCCGLAWLAWRIDVALSLSTLLALVFGAVFIYLSMVAAHLLGLFYYRNSDKLNWEV
jgi:DNA-directed RNA polymerase subunit RPC12/RpoP